MSTSLQSGTAAPRTSNKRLWAGRILTGFAALFILFSAGVKLVRAAPAIEGTVRLGYPESLVFAIGILEFASVVLYLIPRTAVLGAIILTGYLGGATATHVRIADPFFFPIVIGVIVWAGIYLREDRLRPLVPFRR